MKCPNPNCGKPIASVKVQPLPGHAEHFGRSVKCVAYCCDACDTILGVESDPLERDAQMGEIKKAVTRTAGDVDVNLKKLTSLAASVAELKKQQ